MRSRKAQAWGFDVMIATGIFIFGIIVFFLYTLNYPKSQNEKIDDLNYEANKISDDLISNGFPNNWSVVNVTKIGIVDIGKINQTKLNSFYELSVANYGKTRSIFGTKYNYFINASSSLEAFGANIRGIGSEPINAKNNIKVSRIVIYKNKPINLEVQVWE